MARACVPSSLLAGADGRLTHGTAGQVAFAHEDQENVPLEGGGQHDLTPHTDTRRAHAASSSRRSPRIGARRGLQNLPPRTHTRRSALAAAQQAGQSIAAAAAAADVLQDNSTDIGTGEDVRGRAAAAPAAAAAAAPATAAADGGDWLGSPLSSVQQPAASRAGPPPAAPSPHAHHNQHNIQSGDDMDIDEQQGEVQGQEQGQQGRGAAMPQGADATDNAPVAHTGVTRVTRRSHAAWRDALDASGGVQQPAPAAAASGHAQGGAVGAAEGGADRRDLEGDETAQAGLGGTGEGAVGTVVGRARGQARGAAQAARQAQKRAREEKDVSALEGAGEAGGSGQMPPAPRRTRHNAHAQPAAGPVASAAAATLSAATQPAADAAARLQQAASGPADNTQQPEPLPAAEPQMSVVPAGPSISRQGSLVPLSVALQHAAQTALRSSSTGIGSVGPEPPGGDAATANTTTHGANGANNAGQIMTPSVTVMGHEGNALGPGISAGLVVDQEASQGQPASSCRGQLHVAGSLELQLDAAQAAGLTDAAQVEWLMQVGARGEGPVQMEDVASDVGPTSHRRTHRRAGAGVRAARPQPPQPAATAEGGPQHTQPPDHPLQHQQGTALTAAASGGCAHAPEVVGPASASAGLMPAPHTSGAGAHHQAVPFTPEAGARPHTPALYEALSVGPATAMAVATSVGGGAGDSGTSSEVGPAAGPSRGGGRGAAGGAGRRGGSRRGAGAQPGTDSVAHAPGGAAVAGRSEGGQSQAPGAPHASIGGGGAAQGGRARSAEAEDSVDTPGGGSDEGGGGGGGGGLRRRPAGGSATMSDASWGLWGNPLQNFQEWVRGPSSARHHRAPA